MVQQHIRRLLRGLLNIYRKEVVTIVVKPSQLTPENAYVFAQIVDEVGLPKGVFNLVNGRGSVIGHELAANPKVGMVSLTGSVEAGIQTMAAASTNVTKVSLELGGKAPGIVMPDADLDLAVKSIIAGTRLPSA